MATVMSHGQDSDRGIINQPINYVIGKSSEINAAIFFIMNGIGLWPLRNLSENAVKLGMKISCQHWAGSLSVKFHRTQDVDVNLRIEYEFHA